MNTDSAKEFGDGSKWTEDPLSGCSGTGFSTHRADAIKKANPELVNFDANDMKSSSNDLTGDNTKSNLTCRMRNRGKIQSGFN